MKTTLNKARRLLSITLAILAVGFTASCSKPPKGKETGGKVTSGSAESTEEEEVGGVEVLETAGNSGSRIQRVAPEMSAQRMTPPATAGSRNMSQQAVAKTRDVRRDDVVRIYKITDENGTRREERIEKAGSPLKYANARRDQKSEGAFLTDSDGRGGRKIISRPPGTEVSGKLFDDILLKQGRCDQ